MITTTIAAPVHPTPFATTGRNTGQTPDHTLVALTLNGNQQAFTLLTRRYERLVYNVAHQSSTNMADVEEVVQDTFLKAYRFLHTWRMESKFSTWLYRVARSCAMDALRRKKRHTSPLETKTVLSLSDDTPNALDSLLCEDRHRWIETAMNRLSDQDRLVLGVFYFGEKSLDEICQITGWSLSNTKSRLCRARQRLKVHLV